jgi:hypothetical protein
MLKSEEIGISSKYDFLLEQTFGTDGISFNLLFLKSSSPSAKCCNSDPFFKELVTK